MTQIKGTDTSLMLAFEDTDKYNGAITTAAGYLMPFETCSVIVSQGKTENNTILDARTKGKPGVGNVDVGGSVASILGSQSVAVWLKAMFGGHVETGAGPYAHAYTPAEDVPSFALEKDLGKVLATKRFEYLGGCKVATLDFQIAQEGLQKITVNVKGASQVLSDTSMDVSPTDHRDDDPFDGVNVFIEEGGVQVGIVSSGTLTLSNNLDESSGYTIPKETEKQKAGQRQSMPAQFFTAGGSLTALLQDTSFIEKGMDNSTSSLKLRFVRGDGLGTTGNESLEIDLPTVVYERTSAEISGPAGMMLSLNFESFGAVTATLNNSVSL